MALDDLTKFVSNNAKSPNPLWRTQSAYESELLRSQTIGVKPTTAGLRAMAATAPENYFFGIFTRFGMGTSRWSDGTFPVWYGGDSAITALQESMYHIGNAAGISTTDEYRYLINVSCDCDLIDTVGLENRNRWLISNDYPDCQRLGRYVLHRDHSGIRYQSARSKGVCAAIMKRKVLKNPQIMSVVTLSHNGSIIKAISQDGQVVTSRLTD